MANQPGEFNVEDIGRLLRKYLRPIGIIVIAITLVFGAFLQVGAEEVGIITRFGQYVRTVNPGLHLKIPLVEKVQKVPVERQLKQEFGFRTTKADVRTQFAKGSTSRDEAFMLTGDLNLADVEWVIQYRIDDPYNYLFRVRNPEVTLRDISEASMRQIVGDRTVDEVITVGRGEIASEMERLVQERCREYSLGIKVEQVVLQDVNPPDPVKAAFNGVNQAGQERETLINQARAEYNKVIPLARGQAKETIQKAEGYATERVNNAEGEAARFLALYREYVKAQEVTKRRIYLETLAEILPKLGNKVIVDDEGNNVLPLLQMQLEKTLPRTQ